MRATGGARRRVSERGDGRHRPGVIGYVGPAALGVALGVIGYALVVVGLVAVGLFETVPEASTTTRDTVIGTGALGGLVVAAASWSRRSRVRNTSAVVAVALGLVFLALTLADAHVWGTVEPTPAGAGDLTLDALYHLVGPLIAGWGLYELSEPSGPPERSGLSDGGS